MRTLAPALLLLMTSCGQGDRGANRSSGESRESAIAPTIAIAANGCAATWDGQAVTPAQITERSRQLLERVIQAVGGVQNINEHTLPIANVRAPADLGIACADTILFALQRSGMPTVTLQQVSSQGGQAPVLLDFPLETDAPPPPVPMVLGIGAGGQVTWNSDPIDAAGLAAQLTGIGGSIAPVDPMEGSPPPGGLELRVYREATVGQLYELLRTTRRYHLRPYVFLPSNGFGASPVATPPPPPAGPPPFPPVPPPPPPRR